VWLVGPTPARPAEAWVPAATEAKIANFGLAERETDARALVQDVLGLTARRHPSPLPCFVLRWRELHATPLTLFFGLVERDDRLACDWVTSADALTVEPPVVDDLTAPEGVALRRSFAYGVDESGGSVVSVRYVVDTGHAEGFVLAHAASDSPAEILAARDDIEDFLRTVRVSDDPPRLP
jgi:hypothetical protein